jgi:hypothetical protein
MTRFMNSVWLAVIAPSSSRALNAALAASRSSPMREQQEDAQPALLPQLSKSRCITDALRHAGRFRHLSACHGLSRPVTACSDDLGTFSATLPTEHAYLCREILSKANGDEAQAKQIVRRARRNARACDSGCRKARLLA